KDSDTRAPPLRSTHARLPDLSRPPTSVPKNTAPPTHRPRQGTAASAREACQPHQPCDEYSATKLPSSCIAPPADLAGTPRSTHDTAAHTHLPDSNSTANSPPPPEPAFATASSDTAASVYRDPRSLPMDGPSGARTGQDSVAARHPPRRRQP